MINIKNVEVAGWEAAIRGMRNPMNSWEKSDSGYCSTHGPAHCIDCEWIHNGCHADDADINTRYIIGPNDHELMMKLAAGGPVHAKYRRMITVYLDITAPLYWWKEFDTYKVGTVANSCSTMHKIAAKEFTLDDFSCEHLFDGVADGTFVKNPFEENEAMLINPRYCTYLSGMNDIIHILNDARDLYLQTKDKTYWWQMIQLLPSSYNQRRTIMLNYEVLAGIYPMRKNHKLDEWREFCQWIEQLPYSEIIIGDSK